VATEAIFLVLLPLMASRKHSFGKKTLNVIIRKRKTSFYITQRKKKKRLYSNPRTTEIYIYTYGWSIFFAGHENTGQNH